MIEQPFIMRRYILPSGACIDVVYMGEKMDIVKDEFRPMDDYVEEFVDALSLDLIRPSDFGST